MSFTVWLTGLPGAGKTTLLLELCKELDRLGVRVEKLDSDYIHPGFVRPLGTEPRDREIRTRFLAFTAHNLNRHGVCCVAAATTPRIATRSELRALLENFVEVFVKCPLEVAERRDPKNLYAMARSGLIPDFTGVDSPYEEPVSPEVAINTDSESVQEGVSKICDYLVNRGYVTR